MSRTNYVHSPEFLMRKQTRLMLNPRKIRQPGYKHSVEFLAKQKAKLIANSPRHHRLKKPATEKVNCYYNLTFGEYRNMRTLQERRCRICKTHEKNLVRKLLCIDHDHTTGKVRELLCNSCNTGLGCFKDNPKLLQKAINYLKKHIKLGNTPAPV